MKLLTVAALLFSTSAIAVNQCLPDDTCLLFRPFETNEKGFAIAWRNISSAEIKTTQHGRREISINMLEPIDIKNKSSITGYSFGSLEFLDIEYGELRVDSSITNRIAISLNDDPQLKAANKLIDCIALKNSN